MGSIIDISLVEAQLEAYTASTTMEFSGFGWCRREQRGEDSVLVVYRFELLDVGSYGYTQINITGEQITRWSQEPDYKNLKLWAHRHPVNTWSGQDDRTCRFEPLGSIPELVKWAAAIVRTPSGWIGRIDTFGEKPATIHVPVAPNMSVLAITQMKAIVARKEAEQEKKAAEVARKYPSSKQHIPTITRRVITSGQPMKEFNPAQMDSDMFNEVEGFDDPLPDVMCPYCGCSECYDIGYGSIECGECTSEFTREDLVAKEEAERSSEVQHTSLWRRVFKL